MRLIIPQRVIEELDTLKYDRRHQDRAERARRILSSAGSACRDRQSAQASLVTTTSPATGAGSAIQTRYGFDDVLLWTDD